MKRIERPGSIIAMTIVSMVAVETTAHAGVIQGSFSVFANIYVTESFNNVPILSIDAYNVPATISFAVVTYPPADVMSVTIDSSVFSFGCSGSRTGDDHRRNSRCQR